VVGRIEEVRIGSRTFDKPQVHLSRQTKGAFASEEHYPANLGGGFMKRYKVTFDFRGLRVFFE